MKRLQLYTNVLIFAISALVLSGCSSFLDFALRDTVPPDSGSASLTGLEAEVVVRRDELGIPVIEAKNDHDLAFAAGYVMASDRLAQMVSYSLLGQGRLSEMVGEFGLDMDVYIRTLGLPGAAKKEFEALDADMAALLEAFSSGVNAYLASHRDRLPLEFGLTGYTPEPWQPVNSFYIAYLLNLGLSMNFREEAAYLGLARKVGAVKAAWLVPVYPDEPLPFEKASVLADLDLKDMGESVKNLSEVCAKMEKIIMPAGVCASNNWGIMPDRTAKGGSIIANDTHLPLMQPPIWMLMHLRSPSLDAAGVAMPGVPGIVAGYNGRLAWGETIVMGDSQDVFIEKLRQSGGKTFYLYEGNWLPVQTRREVFLVKGKDPVEKTILSTRHGPLVNDVIKKRPKHFAFPPQVELPYGIALQTGLDRTGQSVAAMFHLARAKDMKEARDLMMQVDLMALNFVYGDKDHVAWQVSGTYPLRRSGRGHLPSPGWSGEYDWTGFLDAERLPHVSDPESGFVYTANNRVIPPDADIILSSSWYSPERSQRIHELLVSKDPHTWISSVEMQNDRHDLFVRKVKEVLFNSDLHEKITEAIAGLPDAKQRRQAKEALDMIFTFDGNMEADSSKAAVMGIFRQVFIKNTFLDELGPEDSNAWDSFISLIQAFYPADQDHLLGRPDSPFWDDVNTAPIETKADIIAASLADTICFAVREMGPDRSTWRWGRLHQYRWETASSQAKPFLAFWQRPAVSLLGLYTDRGPYPAGGDYNTLNVAGYFRGQNFNVWLVPAMRMVVDFALEEPMFIINSGGQSGNPASPHYDDGIRVWREGGMRSMPFDPERIKAGYPRVFYLMP